MIDEADRDGDGEVNEARKFFIREVRTRYNSQSWLGNPSFEGGISYLKMCGLSIAMLLYQRVPARENYTPEN